MSLYWKPCVIAYSPSSGGKPFSSQRELDRAKLIDDQFPQVRAATRQVGGASP